MEKYKNPIPHPDDEPESKEFFAGFVFDEPRTMSEAIGDINHMIEKNGGELPDCFLYMGTPRSMRYKLPQNR